MLCCDFSGFDDNCDGIGKIVSIYAGRICDLDSFTPTVTGDCEVATDIPLKYGSFLYELNINQDTAIFAAPIVTDENKSSVQNATLTFSVRSGCKNFRALSGFQQKTFVIIEKSNGKFQIFGMTKGGLFLNNSDGVQTTASSEYIQVQLALNNAPVGGSWLRDFEVNGSYEDTLAYITNLLI